MVKLVEHLEQTCPPPEPAAAVAPSDEQVQALLANELACRLAILILRCDVSRFSSRRDARQCARR